MQEECFSTPNDTDFSFNGKELQTFADLYLYDYHWRHGATFRYDPQLGRWHNIDPSADSYHGLSPYNYCFNNPVMTIDPDGKDPITLAFVVAAAWTAFKVGAVTSAIMYTATHTSNFNVQHFLESTLAGGLISAATAGLNVGSSYLGLSLLGKTTGLARGLLGLGYQMASTAATSVIGNVLVGRQWDSNFNIGVGAFTLPFRNGSFSLNPLDHLDNIYTIRQHYNLIRASIKGYGKISFDLQSLRFKLTASKYAGNMKDGFISAAATGGTITIHDEKAINQYYDSFYETSGTGDEYGDYGMDGIANLKDDDNEFARETALSDFRSGATAFHEGIHTFQMGIMGAYTFRSATIFFVKHHPNVIYELRPWEKIAFKLENKFKGK